MDSGLVSRRNYRTLRTRGITTRYKRQTGQRLVFYGVTGNIAGNPVEANLGRVTSKTGHQEVP